VAIARAMATEPVLLLADEPTGELDSATASIVFTLLRDLARREGLTVITCTHDRLVMEMADRVEELADGRLVTGHRGDVWKHVQARARSPFDAVAGHEAGVSSLVGADARQFAPPANGASTPHPDPALPAEPPEAEAGEAPDISRWAPPECRP
jgi:ABC-type sulfate/molybdate transport systems ATPase subunit